MASLMHCTPCGWQKGTSQDEAMLNSVATSIVKLHLLSSYSLAEGMSEWVGG